MTNPSLKAQLKSTAAGFSACESGGATIWNLIWLVGFVGMAGLAVDTTNARRVETMLVSTADAASNAAVMQLPPLYLELGYEAGTYVNSEDEALTVSQLNMDMDPERHGEYIARENVFVGNWDIETRTFTAEGEPVNAVRVFVGRNNDRQNSVSTSMLRVLGLYNWDINATSTSLMQISKCLKDGLIAREAVDLASNLTIHAGMCIHGENMVEIQNNVAWHPSTTVTHNEDAFRKIQEGQYDMTNGEHVVLPVITHSMEPAMVDMIPTIAYGMLTADTHYQHFGWPRLTSNANQVVMLNQQDITGSEVESVEAPAGVQRASVERLAPVRHAAAAEVTLEGPLWEEVRTAGLFGNASLASLISGSAKAGVQGPVDWSDDLTNLENNNDGWVEKPTHGEFDQPYDTTEFWTGWTPREGAHTASKLTEDRVYFLSADDCQGSGNKLTLSGEIHNVTIVAQCKIEIATDTILSDVVLFAIPVEKPGENNFNAITVGEGAQIGAVDNCEGAGGVRMYTTKSVHAAASSKWVEAQIIARYDIDFAGQSDAVQGISAHAGRKIKIQSNAVIGGYAPDGYVENPEETSCIADGVGLEWTRYDYSYPIVD